MAPGEEGDQLAVVLIGDQRAERPDGPVSADAREAVRDIRADHPREAFVTELSNLLHRVGHPETLPIAEAGPAEHWVDVRGDELKEPPGHDPVLHHRDVQHPLLGPGQHHLHQRGGLPGARLQLLGEFGEQLLRPRLEPLDTIRRHPVGDVVLEHAGPHGPKILDGEPSQTHGGLLTLFHTSQ